MVVLYVIVYMHNIQRVDWVSVRQLIPNRVQNNEISADSGNWCIKGDTFACIHCMCAIVSTCKFCKDYKSYSPYFCLSAKKLTRACSFQIALEIIWLPIQTNNRLNISSYHLERSIYIEFKLILVMS